MKAANSCPQNGPLCAAVGFSEGVESQNIVGYNTLTLDATDGESMYPSFGMSFVPVGGGTARLGDYKMVEGTYDADSDNIQVIDPVSLDTSSLFAYCGPTRAAELVAEIGGTVEDYIGWWDFAIGYFGEDGARADNYVIHPGDGFLGLFASGNAVQIVSSGEAPTVTTTFTTTGGEAAYQMIANYIPKAIPLKKIVPVDGTFDADSDNLQIIDPATLDTTALLAYCGPTRAAELVAEMGGKAEDYIGWWDFAIGYFGEDGAKADDYVITPGQGFLGMFASGSEITFQFPSSLN